MRARRLSVGNAPAVRNGLPILIGMSLPHLPIALSAAGRPATELRFRALNSLRIERLRALLNVHARQAFDELPERLLASFGEAVQGIYLMGSAGTLGQGQGSDLDLWIICKEGGQAPTAAFAEHLLRQHTAWCQAHGLDLRAFLVKPEQLRAGDRSILAGDDCGSTQDRLLLDEFYRTAVLLRGAAPLWWLVAADDEHRYNALAPALTSAAYVDLGGIPAIPDDEFLGATLWHLHKALEAPHKSLLKLLLLEAYALEGGEPLALQYKRLVHNPKTDLQRIDPYHLMYQRIEQYLLRRGDLRRLHLARLCLVRKAETSIATSWQHSWAHTLRSEWGWTAEDPAPVPAIEALLQEHLEIARQLDAGHSLLRQWADATPARFAADRDMQLLEAELAAHSLDWPGKVQRLNTSLKQALSEPALRLREQEGLWRLETDCGTELMRDPSLAHVVAWSCLNGLWPTELPARLDHAAFDLLSVHLRELTAVSRVTAEALLSPPAPQRELLFLLDEQQWQIERVTLNSWGEVSARSLNGLAELNSVLPEVAADLVEVHAPAQRHPAPLGKVLLQQLLQHRPPTPMTNQRLLVEGAGCVLCLEPDVTPRMLEFRTFAELLAHLHATPLRTDMQGDGDLLAPLRALAAVWQATTASAPDTSPQAHLLLLPASADHSEDYIVLLDRDGVLCCVPLAHRPFEHQQDAIRLFLANAGRRLRIATRAWRWEQRLTPLLGRIYLPERLRVIQHSNGRLDLESGGQVFRAIDTDGDAVALARARIRDLRLATRRGSADDRTARGAVAAAGDALLSYPPMITDVATADRTRTPLRELLLIKLRAETILSGTAPHAR